MLKQLKDKSRGFTIIEVMIVLAIAGLIMVIVLIAVPQLQRNQRNTARKAIAGRIKAELDNYAGNNNGKIPSGSTEVAGFVARYLTNVNINDPKTGTASSVVSATGVGATGTFNYNTTQACDGENITTGVSNRQYSLSTTLEGNAVYCLDNQ